MHVYMCIYIYIYLYIYIYIYIYNFFSYLWFYLKLISSNSDLKTISHIFQKTNGIECLKNRVCYKFSPWRKHHLSIAVSQNTTHVHNVYVGNRGLYKTQNPKKYILNILLYSNHLQCCMCIWVMVLAAETFPTSPCTFHVRVLNRSALVLIIPCSV
jgi:hypothetical protein